MAGFVAVAVGAVMPGVATSISKIFSKVLALRPLQARVSVADARLTYVLV